MEKEEEGTSSLPRKMQRKEPKPFDITKYPSVHIALQLQYNGTPYDGFAKQDNTPNTIEGHLVAALKATRLIPDTGPCAFSRCARTDKGVSALRNAVALEVRAALEGQPAVNYIRILNRALPPSIRVLQWCPVASSFNARFACRCRSYRYYFSGMGLDVEAMKRAASHLAGRHDFRNFCKMDIVHVRSFVREIQHVEICPTATFGSLVHYLHIVADAFLYHQIRCIVAVLFLVGQHLEEEDVVLQLLDVGAVPGKPCYALAPAEPLVLWDCVFDDSIVRWQMPQPDPHCNVPAQLEQQGHEVLLQSAMCLEMGREIARCCGCAGDVENPTTKPHPRYVKLLHREKEGTFEHKLFGLSKAKRARREQKMDRGNTEGQQESNDEFCAGDRCADDALE